MPNIYDVAKRARVSVATVSAVHPPGAVRLGGAVGARGRRRQAGALVVREGRGELGGGGPEASGVALPQRPLDDVGLLGREGQPLLEALDVALGEGLTAGPVGRGLVGVLCARYREGERDEGRKGQGSQRGSYVHGEIGWVR